MQSKKIVSIDIKEIHPHPENPRKDLGDLTELSESIKKNGVMQNLTVIKGHWDEKKKWNEEGYTLLIGHRRCAAAGIAGIKELPCMIVEGMEKKEQLSTMLEENMQRNDLTIYEQAQGFQMMIDLGETAEQIAEKTGFSQTTVRHRLNIAKLDQTVLKEKEKDEEFQLSIRDLYEMEKIKDIKKRNEVLKSSTDSRSLQWKIQQAIREETAKKNMKVLLGLFKKSGIKKSKINPNEAYSTRWEILQEWDLKKEQLKPLKKFEGNNIQYVKLYGDNIAIIKPAEKKKRELSEYELRQQEEKKKRKELKQLQNDLYDEIDNFIMGITKKEIEPIKEDINLYKDLITAMVKGDISYGRSHLSRLYCGKPIYELGFGDEKEYRDFKKWEKNMSPLNLAIAYMSSVRSRDIYYSNGTFRKDNAEKVQAVIDFLKRYGFCLSEVHEQMIDGTHEAYVKGNDQ